MVIVAAGFDAPASAQRDVGRSALHRARSVQAGLPDPSRAIGPRDPTPTPFALVPVSVIPSGVLHVGAGRRLHDLPAALAWIARHRIPRGRTVEIALDPGVYEHVAPIHVRHIDASRVRLRGAPEIALSIGAVGASTHDACPEGALAIDVGPRSARAAPIGAYVLVHDTSGPDSSHLALRGVWRICGRNVGRGTLSVVFHRGASDQIPTVRGARAVVLRSVLRFYCSAGILVEGTELGLLEDLVLVGDHGDRAPAWNSDGAERDPFQRFGELAESGRACDHVDRWTETHTGITAWREGAITLGRWVGVTSFDGQGVLASDAGIVRGEGVASVHNQRRGFYAMNRAELDLDGAIAAANRTDGFLADHGGFVVLRDALAVANHENGIAAMFGGHARAVRARTASNGGWGVRAKVGALVEVRAVLSHGDARGPRLAEHGSRIADEVPLTTRSLALREAVAARAARGSELVDAPSVDAGHEIVVPVGPSREVTSLAAALAAWERVYIPPDVVVRLVLDPGVHEIGSIVVDHPCAAQIEIVGAGLRDPDASDLEPRVRVTGAEIDAAHDRRSSTVLHLEAGVGAEMLREGDVIVLAEVPGTAGARGRDARRVLGAWSVQSVAREDGAVHAHVTTRDRRSWRGPSSAHISVAGARGVIRRTRLRAACGGGVVVRGTSLGLLGNLVLERADDDVPCDEGSDGIRVERGGYAVIGAAVAVVGFEGSGLDVRGASAAYARAVVTSGNGLAGLVARDGSSIEAKSSAAVANAGAGYLAATGSTLYVALSSTVGNARSGFVATADGHVSATESFAGWNGMHGYAAEHGVVDVPGRASGDRSRSTRASTNGLDGYFARGGVLALDHTSADANARSALRLLSGAVSRGAPESSDSRD